MSNESTHKSFKLKNALECAKIARPTSGRNINEDLTFGLEELSKSLSYKCYLIKSLPFLKINHVAFDTIHIHSDKLSLHLY